MSYMIPLGLSLVYISDAFLILFVITVCKIKFSILTDKFSLHFGVLGFFYNVFTHKMVRFILVDQIKNESIFKMFYPARAYYIL